MRSTLSPLTVCWFALTSFCVRSQPSLCFCVAGHVMWDFFRLVSLDTVGTNNQVVAVHDASLFRVVLEIAVFIAIGGILGSAIAALLPSVVELGSISAFLRKRELASSRRLSHIYAPVSGPSSAGVLCEKTTNEAAKEPPVEAPPADKSKTECTHVASSGDTQRQSLTSHAAAQPHVDIDAVLDEFCNEEELMDDAFVSSVLAPTSSHRPATEHVPQASAPTQTSVERRSKHASESHEADLAKKMMKGFAAAGSSRPKHDPKTSGSEKVRTDAVPVVDKAPKAPPRAVDLDAVFDEMELTEEALNDALLDAVVSS